MPSTFGSAMMMQKVQGEEEDQRQQGQDSTSVARVEGATCTDLDAPSNLHQVQLTSGLNSGGTYIAPQGDSSQFLNTDSNQDPHIPAFYSVLDQKIRNPRFENPLAQTMGMTPTQVFYDPRIPQFDLGWQDSAEHGYVGNIKDSSLQQLPAHALVRGNRAPLPSPHTIFQADGSRRMRGGAIEPFPERLHRLLHEVESAGRSDVISFVAEGRAFCIHKPDKFFKEIVPMYFRQSRLSSFKRQLNLYGFELISSGPARGAYYHECFVKDRAELCRGMRRLAAAKVAGVKGKTPLFDIKIPTKTENDCQDKMLGDAPKLKCIHEKSGSDGDSR